MIPFEIQNGAKLIHGDKSQKSDSFMVWKELTKNEN